MSAAAPSAETLFAVLAATWPPAAVRKQGPWLLREGAGGGKRVSAATAEGPFGPDDIAAAEQAMRALGQAPLFMLRPESHPGDAVLDEALAARGYMRSEPTVIYAAPARQLLPEPLPVMQVLSIWPPLAIQRELWAEEGIGPERLRVMERASDPRVALMARQSDRVAGAGFIAMHQGIAMLHAVVVTAALRRRGAARNLTRGAAEWAMAQGAEWLALAVTEANQPARLLYAGLGMEPAARYHYRSSGDI
ncbi:GNAT family N-acetyltransferase [Alkalilacustris brevis]|uniref:GNAT family N-acetyltransferase n=1 Tax=Alkalilacustris brevis TaxID=2026338 RepID=UPI000E0CC3E6|nr:GNAT family N-acetyltransferase [Alkalilacustris brevis]